MFAYSGECLPAWVVCVQSYDSSRTATVATELMSECAQPAAIAQHSVSVLPRRQFGLYLRREYAHQCIRSREIVRDNILDMITIRELCYQRPSMNVDILLSIHCCGHIIFLYALLLFGVASQDVFDK